MGKIIVIRKADRILVFTFSDYRPDALQVFFSPGKDDLVGNVYVGRVDRVLPSMGAAFVAVQKDRKVYLPLPSCKDRSGNTVIWNGKPDDALKAGDEILVQIERMGMGDKLPTARTDIDLVGHYCICRVNGKGMHFSKKLSSSVTASFREALSARGIPGRRDFGFTIRTNIEALKDYEEVFCEMEELIRNAVRIREASSHRSIYSCLYQDTPEYISYIKGIPISSYEEIVTEDPGIYEELQCLFPTERLRLYTDTSYPLEKLYSISTHLKEALSEKVWLKNGGYLIIQKTEAMTVIDVNSGKGSEKKGNSKEDMVFAMNCEAASEIARQLRLRNHSGIIVVDFINMEEEPHKQQLLTCFDRFLKEDKLPCRVVDLTPLGIVEVTRKKFNKPLKEMLDNIEL